MNNLKRVFSLALAGAMLAGMMVMGASAADFTDYDKIVNTEAVDVNVALGIIDGQSDGSFNPEGNVTRAQMAKMIAVAVNGGKTPNTGVKSTPTYTDIKGHWAEQFIEYCTDMKYINGRGDGTFDPDGNVTGIEAAKMVLTALGYDAKAYQLTGADWAINTNFIATRTCDISLYDNMAGVAMNAPLSRDNAAQMIWNGLQNFVVEYNPDVSITGGDLSYGYKKSTTTKLLGQAYGGQTWVGTFDGNADFHSASGTKAGEIVVLGKLDTADANVSAINANVPSDLDIDFIGEEVKVIFKDGKGGYSNRPDNKDVIYGVFLTGKTDVVRGNLSMFGDNKVKDEARVKFDGTKYDVAPTVTVYNNFAGSGTNFSGGAASSTGSCTYRTDSDVNSDLTDYLKKTSGAAVKMTFNANNEVENIYITESKIARVTAINSSKVSMNNGVGSITIADNDIYEGVKKDDVVIVTTLYDTDPTKDTAFTTVEKAEPVNGTITAYEGTASNTKNLTLDGTTYKVDKGVSGTNSMYRDVVTSNDGVQYLANTNLDEEFDVYLINGFAVAAVQLSESNSNYSVIISKNKGTGGTAAPVGAAVDGAKAEVLTTEGKKVLTLNSDSYDYVADTKIVDSDGYAVGDIVTFSTDKDGFTKLEKRAAYATTVSDTVSYKSGTKVVTIGSATYNTSSDCVVFMDIDNTEGTDWKQYTLRDLKTFSYVGNGSTALNLTYYVDDGELVALVLTGATVGSRPAGAIDNTVYGIVSTDPKNSKKDGTAYSYVKVQSNGEEYEVYTNETIAKGDIVRLEITNDSIYGSSELKVVNSYAYISNASNKTEAGYVKDYREGDKTITVSKTYSLTADSQTYKVDGDTAVIGTYAITGDTEFYYVNRDDKKGVDSASVAPMDPIKHTMNVIVVVDTSSDGDEAAVVIFETSNEAEIVKDIDTFGANGYGYDSTNNG